MNNSDTVPVVGLLGGVGAGKSSVARWVAEHRPILVIDADIVGHELLRDSQVQSSIRDRFGDHVFDDQGAVDRRALGRLVFADGAETELAALNAILHPLIRREIEITIGKARASREVEAIVLDAAVMLDAGWNHACDALVFVDTPYEQRLRNVTVNRGWTEAELRRREAAQLSLEHKRGVADHILPNDGTLDVAGARFVELLDAIRDRPDHALHSTDPHTPTAGRR